MGFTVTGWDFSFKRSSHQTRLHSVISTRCCEDETVNKDVYLHVNTPGLPQSASSSCEPPPAVSLLQPRVSRQINGLEQYVMIPTLWHHHARVCDSECVCAAHQQSDSFIPLEPSSVTGFGPRVFSSLRFVQVSVWRVFFVMLVRVFVHAVLPRVFPSVKAMSSLLLRLLPPLPRRCLHLTSWK